MSDPFEAPGGRALRTGRRYTIRTEFHLGASAGLGEIRLDTEDLSIGGAFLAADLLFEVGEVLSLSFSLPGSERLIRARGRIAWVSRGESGTKPPGMGLEFLDLSDDDRAAIEAALSASE
jgi:uncharacterized protein (TIGR02266 family)